MSKKKIVVVLLILCLICPLFASCVTVYIKPLNVSFMKDLSIDVTNVKGYAVKKDEQDEDTGSKQQVEAETGSTRCVQVLDGRIDSKYMDYESRDYLYSTTILDEIGAVDYDLDEIKKVIFKKNALVKEDVYDSEGNLIDDDTIITQDDIPAKINRFYVTSKFMFLQFIPLISKSGVYGGHYEDGTRFNVVIDVRPEELVYDEDGIAEFDKQGYLSNGLCQTFVVDVQTGYIYKISGMAIWEILTEDVVYINVRNHGASYYKMSINENDELIFNDVVPNDRIEVYAAVSDKYGYSYICNSDINSVDHEQKIIYTTSRIYIDGSKQVYFDGGKTKVVDGVKVENDRNGFVNDFKLVKFYKGDYEIKIYGTPINGYINGKTIYNYNFIGNSSNNKCLVEDSIYANNSIKWFNNDATTNILMMYNKYYYLEGGIEQYYNTKTYLNEEDFTLIPEFSGLHYEEYTYITVGKSKFKILNVYYREELSKTVYYRLVKDGNEVKLEKLLDRNYSSKTFVFQPINKI